MGYYIKFDISLKIAVYLVEMNTLNLRLTILHLLKKDAKGITFTQNIFISVLDIALSFMNIEGQVHNVANLRARMAYCFRACCVYSF